MSVNLSQTSIPRHLGIIMDGNGRWAQKRGLPRITGHLEGVQTVIRTVENCIEIGIQILTLYTFSTENWRRPKEEVNFLMKLAEEYTMRELPDLQRNGVRLQLMGNREGLPISLLSILDKAALETKENSRLILNLALNYGGRAEIVNAMKTIIADHQRGNLKVNEINETTFSHYLYCPNMPDVDLIVRTGGEWRLSNFLTWRSTNTLFWCTPVLWPDFQQEYLLEAIGFYAKQFRGDNDNE
ncbi:MAG: di-trans,poly-cis-decaprenylcistransferase [Anaerolineaceae bacterium]|jgi:undecaprenyl diphosphate synthase|nr:di-trans,poly-cis-decaprenylcistransferase [Anaerolineaceae bacterium]